MSLIDSVTSLTTLLAFPAGGLLGIARNLLDVFSASRTVSQPQSSIADSVALANAQTLLNNSISTVSRRRKSDEYEDDELSAPLGGIENSTSAKGFNLMKWVRLGFASVAIILYLALSLLYIQSLASHETFPKEVASIVLTLLGNIAGYYFLTRHFGGSKQL